MFQNPLETFWKLFTRCEKKIPNFTASRREIWEAKPEDLLEDLPSIEKHFIKVRLRNEIK